LLEIVGSNGNGFRGGDPLPPFVVVVVPAGREPASPELVDGGPAPRPSVVVAVEEVTEPDVVGAADEEVATPVDDAGAVAGTDVLGRAVGVETEDAAVEPSAGSTGPGAASPRNPVASPASVNPTNNSVEAIRFNRPVRAANQRMFPPFSQCAPAARPSTTTVSNDKAPGVFQRRRQMSRNT